MPIREAAVELLAILDRFLANTGDEANQAALLRSLESLRSLLQSSGQTVFNIDIKQLTGGENQFGDIYNQIYNQTYNQTDLETLKQVLLEILRSSSAEPPPPSPEEQREAVGQFLHWVEQRFRSVRFLHRRGETVALKDQYIPIQVTLDKQRETSSAGRYLGYVESEAELQRAYALKQEDEKREQVDWQTAKQQHSRIMVLADPGMGKTTLLRIEAGTIAAQAQQALAEGSKMDTVILPVWIRLSNLAEQVQQVTDTVLEAILKLVKAEWDDRLFAKLQPLLEAKLRTGQCVLLLDALDEVPRTLRKRLSEKLNRFALKYPCPIVCTSRIVGYTGLINGATQVEIVPFSQPQTEQYIKTWFTNAADYLDDETVSATNLMRELQSKPQIQGLAQNPLLLSLLCSLYQEKGITLPARRCQVYAKAVEYMLGKWHIDNQRQAQDSAWIDAKTELLEELAYQFTCDNKELFDLRELRQKIDRYKKSDSASSDFEGISATDLITELTEQDGILQKLSEKEYLFFHRTFQEYFTASYLVRAGKDGIPLAKAHLWNFEWHETLTLMAGLMAEPLDLIQAILDEKDDIFYTQLLLVGRCLTECADSTNPLMKTIVRETIPKIHQFWCRYPDAEFIESVVVAVSQVSSDALKMLQETLIDEDSGVKSIVIEVLSKMNSMQAATSLISLLQDEDGDVRVSAATALIKFGTTEAFDTLTSALQDEDCYIKLKAAEALSAVGNIEAVNTLVVILLNEQNDHGYYKMRAAWTLKKFNGLTVVDAFITALQDDDEDIRLEAAIALGKIGGAAAVDALILELQNNSSSWYTAMALGRIGDEKAVDILISALQYKGNLTIVRSTAAEALGEIKNARAIDVLVLALQDEEIDVRWSAVEALGRIGGTLAVNILTCALQHECRDIRLCAAVTLGRIHSGLLLQLDRRVTVEATDALISVIQEDSGYGLTRFALKALGEIGGEAEAIILTSVLQNKDDYFYEEETLKALGQIGNKKAVDALIPKLCQSESLYKPNREVAVRALEQISSTNSEEVLMKLLNYRDLDIYSVDVILFIRRLAIRVSREGGDCVPVYPERVRALREKDEA